MGEFNIRKLFPFLVFTINSNVLCIKRYRFVIFENKQLEDTEWFYKNYIFLLDS